MIKLLLAFIAFQVTFTLGVNAQTKQNQKEQKQSASAAGNNSVMIPTVRLSEKDKPLELAKSALKAHGSDKLANLRNLVLRGAVEAMPPGFSQSIPGAFAIVQAGNKSRLQIDLAGFGFIQIFDGQKTSSTLTAINLPPLTRYGLLLLAKIEETGYVVSESKKRQPFSFNLGTPTGDIIEYNLDPATRRIKSCLATFRVDGNEVSTALEYQEFKEVNGIVVPTKFWQRIDLNQGSAYINFKTKDILVNTKIDDNIFVLEQKR